eukprot:scaffold53237_cov28-Tisochrysis_lutea.AAC.2
MWKVGCCEGRVGVSTEGAPRRSGLTCGTPAFTRKYLYQSTPNCFSVRCRGKYSSSFTQCPGSADVWRGKKDAMKSGEGGNETWVANGRLVHSEASVKVHTQFLQHGISWLSLVIVRNGEPRRGG